MCLLDFCGNILCVWSWKTQIISEVFCVCTNKRFILMQINKNSERDYNSIFLKLQTSDFFFYNELKTVNAFITIITSLSGRTITLSLYIRALTGPIEPFTNQLFIFSNSTKWRFLSVKRELFLSTIIMCMFSKNDSWKVVNLA